MSKKSQDSSTEIADNQLDQVSGGIGALDALPVINSLNSSPPPSTANKVSTESDLKSSESTGFAKTETR
ncbi:MAG: hypothetical protein AAGC81_04510 [Pseudomonadota bacterium]